MQKNNNPEQSSAQTSDLKNAGTISTSDRANDENLLAIVERLLDEETVSRFLRLYNLLENTQARLSISVANANDTTSEELGQHVSAILDSEKRMLDEQFDRILKLILDSAGARGSEDQNDTIEAILAKLSALEKDIEELLHPVIYRTINDKSSDQSKRE